MSEKVLVTPQELKLMLGKSDVVVIDTRSPDAFAAGHIPGAVNVHDIFTYLAMSTPEGMEELKGKFAEIFGAAGLSGAETAVIYEGSMNSGFGQSCRGYFLLKFLGYPKALVLHGGLAGWQAEGGTVTADASTPPPKQFPLVDTGTSMMIGRDEMIAALGDESIALLDVRDVDEWVGDSSSPYGKDFCPRKGRIPGSRWIEWYRLMKPTPQGPMFKAPDEIMAECHSVGIDKSTPVGLTRIALRCDLDADADDAKLERMIETVERYCVIFQTLKQPPTVSVSRASEPAAH